MIIHLSGLHPQHPLPAGAPENISWAGYVFDSSSPFCVSLRTSMSGIIPNRALPRQRDLKDEAAMAGSVYAGLFTDMMPQSIISDVVAYHLRVIVLYGNEKPVLMDNLRRSLVPDLCGEICMVKRIVVNNAADMERASEYEQVADYLLLEHTDSRNLPSLQAMCGDIPALYKGELPFLVGGRLDEWPTMKHCLPAHELFAGVSLHV